MLTTDLFTIVGYVKARLLYFQYTYFMHPQFYGGH